ncbi:hypothetical protein [Nitrosomonas ureae]|uniref:Uncharacterized protein n=1 Tax=Nitrosomonas ureae TaxID=44577 RepID=A0A1H5SA32_9PROT|nr:hypothetical protein [Nitrosomonas ureae]SEF46701.1 hypothetical protein SAMN05216334_10256 [Nitrosomonas ureae]
MTLREGRTKLTLQSSIDSALLVVEVYNKPRTTDGDKKTWELSDEDRSAFDKISVIIKDKRVTIEAANAKRTTWNSKKQESALCIDIEKRLLDLRMLLE